MRPIYALTGLFYGAFLAALGIFVLPLLFLGISWVSNNWPWEM